MVATPNTFQITSLQLSIIVIMEKIYDRLVMVKNGIAYFFGMAGTLVLIVCITPLIPLLYLSLIIVIKWYAKILNELIQHTSSNDAFQQITWDDLKDLENKLTKLKSMIEALEDAPYLSKGLKSDIATIVSSTTTVLANLESSYSFNGADRETHNVWNEFNDIWNYPTPEEDKKMLYDINKSSR